MNTTYNNRTPETIKAEMDNMTEAGVLQLAEFLQTWMANSHNDRIFILIAKDKQIGPPAIRARLIFGHAYDWFAYGN